MLFPLKNQILKRTTMIEKGMAINMMMNRKIYIIARRYEDANMYSILNEIQSILHYQMYKLY